MNNNLQLKPYHYTESGLDNIYLKNGFKFSDDGERISIQDIDGLHKAIGLTIVKGRKQLSGKDIRFLRTEMLLSQARLASMFGLKELTVSRWEKDSTPIPATADAVLRSLYLEFVDAGNGMKEILTLLAELEHITQKICLQETDNGWVKAA